MGLQASLSIILLAKACMPPRGCLARIAGWDACFLSFVLHANTAAGTFSVCFTADTLGFRSVGAQ